MTLRILHVEDSEDDSYLLHRALVRGGIPCHMERSETHDQFLDHLKLKDFDLILSDYSLPGFSGHQALALAREHAPEIPFIFVSGTIGEERAIDSLHNGATDCVSKSHLSRLPHVVERALREARQRERSQEMEKRILQAQNLERVSTLAGGIAHDFNNILTIIKGHASLLDRECERPGRVREISAIIDHAARRGADLVREMLAFARKSDGIFSSASFNQVVREAAEMLQQTLPPNIHLEFALDDGLHEIMVDTGQLERVIINLVGNARDAMPDGGRILISTGRILDAATVPCLANLPAREYALLQISDTGTGMDETTRSRIFEPFFTTKSIGKGTGLGMPVVYGVMQMHHGAIDVISAPGKGTSVELYFPLISGPEHPAMSKPPAKPRTRGGSETLLVVDDEPDVLSFLQVMLEAEGYQVFAAGNAEEAIALFHAHRHEIKLIFSDLGLPTLSGYDLGQILHQHKPDIKILLGSGYVDSDRQEHLQNLENGFISKPYTPESVLAAIRATLDEARTKTPIRKHPAARTDERTEADGAAQPR